MIIYSQHVFEKIFLDKDPSDFIKYISAGVERELVTKVIDKLGDHKLYIVKLQEPEIIEDLPEYWNDTCAYRQKLECEKIVQCKDCKMVYPWCQKFRDEFGGNGFCPYGKPAKVHYIDEATDCSTCKWGEWYRNGRDITNIDDECGGCCSWNSKWTPKETETEAERLDRIDNEIEDAWVRIKELTPQTDCD